MELPFVTLDVFTTTPYAGNPLALVLVPPELSSSLNQQQKQTIAREFNLSETAFLHLNDDASKTEWRLDIFMTTTELPFAGHPTIGTAHYVVKHLLGAGRGTATLVTKSGPITLERTDEDGGVSASISHNVRIHSKQISSLNSDTFAAMLSTVPILASKEKIADIVSIVKGMTFACIELPDLQTLDLASAEGKSINGKDSGLLDQGWDSGFVGKYYFVKEDEKDGVVRVRTRMIEGLLEDPATGSAASALSSYLALRDGVNGGRSIKYEITQGVEMGRTSNIVVEVAVKAGGTAIESVKLSGNAVQVMKGSLTI